MELELNGYTFCSGDTFDTFEEFYDMLGEDVHDHLSMQQIWDNGYIALYQGEDEPWIIIEFTKPATMYEPIVITVCLE